jgi:hypothetical protein
MYSKIGVLSSKNIFKKVTRNDLVAGYLGQTAIKTKNVIQDCIGGVLFIDEAYSLGNADDLDSFSRECIDTLCEALSDHKDHLMVIIAGYEDELKKHFFSANPGLESRFIWRFKIDTYSASELREIFVKKVVDVGWSLVEELPVSWFEKHKGAFIHYGRDMENLLLYVKISHSKRVFGLSETERKKINEKDMQSGMDMFLLNKKDDKKDKRVRDLLSTMYI